MQLVTVNVEGQSLLGFVHQGAAYAFRDVVSSYGGWDAIRSKFDAAHLDAGCLEDFLALLDAGPRAWRLSAALVEAFSKAAPADVSGRPLETLEAPIPRPRKNIFCVGRNYADHAKERGAKPPEHPVFFTKAPTTVVGPDAVVPYPAQTGQLDYEGELAVVIGQKGRDVPKERAYDYVFGYTIVNDLTARDLQARHQQFFKGKSLDDTCPMGPWVVPKESLDRVDSLSIRTRVNGEVRQSANTADMIFDIPTILSVLSAGMTLEPGDVVATGTPSGVGAATGRFLVPGDRVEVEIESIGVLRTEIGPQAT